MRKGLVVGFLILVSLFLVSSLFAAQEAVEVAKMKSTFGFFAGVVLGAALGVGIAACGCGVGMGHATRGACEGIARNPEIAGRLTVSMILGIAFMESLTLYALVVSLILLYANPMLSKVMAILGG